MSQIDNLNDNNDNKIELKTVGELSGMNFYIPKYQRGYRWKEQQVRDLLNDINEFNNNQGFYCLQPLVVKLRMETVDKGSKGTWEVIDGQQRLTTIYILMRCLGIADKNYTLTYETREKGNKSFLAGNLEINEDNIDFYHISTSKQVIREWLSGRDCESIKEKLLNKVNFIWYESVNEDPIKVFTRLNIAKISLTSSELIKALFLNRSNFNMQDKLHVKLRQQEIASEWDLIEYSLQNNEFWLFLHENGYDHPTRIDFIFDLICQSNKFELKDYEDKIGSDGYRTFRYFYEYFNTRTSGEKDNTTEEDNRMVSCWKTVQSYFHTFQEWYNDLEMFHYIGFLIACKDSTYIRTYIQKWHQQTNKKCFLHDLKAEVKDIINCPGLDYQYKEDGSDKGKCKAILLFHNIQTVINKNQSQQNNEKYEMGTFYKFPFHLYKLENWDVEHINSNTTNPEDDEDSQKEWLLNIYLGVSELLQNKIQQYFEASPENRSTLFQEIKKEVHYDYKEWSQEEKNKIWNYTLLDSSTNRSYGNSIFPGKRRVIIEKDKGQSMPVPKLSQKGLVMDNPQKSSSAFVPPCTRQVFLKYYSAVAGDNNYWTLEDAQSYLKDMEFCINKLEE